MFIKSRMCGIYKITCFSNKKIYIGSSVNIGKRFRVHKSLLRSNKHRNPHLQNAWNEYGEENFKFEIIEIVKTNLLWKRELIWFDKTECCDPKYGFNIAINPTNGMLGRLHTEESKLKMSMSGKNKVFTEKHKLNLSLAAKERKASKIARENMSKAHKGLHIGSKHGMAKLNEWKIRIIKRLSEDRYLTQKEIAKIFNVSQQTISRIVNNKTWKHT